MMVESLPAYTAKTFLWMFLGLLTTFAVAVGGYVSGLTVRAILSVPAFHIVILVAELAVGLVLSARAMAMRWHSPPESWVGRCPSRCPSPT